MGKRIAAVDAYIAKQQPFAKPILVHLRDTVHEVCTGADEVIKWGMPHFEYKGPFAGMAAFKAHATFGFWKEKLLRQGGAALPEPDEKAMGSFGCIRSLDDLPSRRALASLIRAAMKLNEDGVKSPKRPSVRKPAVRPPVWFMAALRRKPKALAHYEAFPPGQKREYVEWVTEAKTEATREKRLATTLAWLAEGKRRNWKYERA